MRKSSKTSKLRFTGLCEGNPPVSGGLPSQKDSYAKNVSIWGCHYVQWMGYTIGRLMTLRSHSSIMWFISRWSREPVRLRHHDDVIIWSHFPRYWPFVWGIHRPPVTSHHKGQRRGSLMFSLIFAWTYGNHGDVGHLTCHWAQYDVTVMMSRPILATCSVWY